MSRITPPPIADLLFDPDDEGWKNPIANLTWIKFFSSLYTGDTGVDWSPNFVGLGISGAAPKISGRVYQISKSVSFFNVLITPQAGGNTTATPGATKIDNYPLSMLGDGVVFAVSGFTGTNAGQCEKASNNIYVPAWTAVTIPLSLVGLVAAQ